MVARVYIRGSKTKSMAETGMALVNSRLEEWQEPQQQIETGIYMQSVIAQAVAMSSTPPTVVDSDKLEDVQRM